MTSARTIYVHVGLPKAGSTTLQTFFMANRSRLAAQGVVYPASGPYHHKVAHHVWARAMKGDRFGYWWMPPGDPRYAIEPLHRALIDDIEAAPQPKVLLSAEELWHPAVPATLGALFADRPWTVRVLVYVRRQDDLLISAYNQCVKTLDPRLPDRETIGGIDEFVATELSDPDSLFDLRPILEGFIAAFGPESLIVRPVEPDQLVGGCLVDDALTALGLDPDDDYERPARLNASLPQSLIELIHRFNQRNRLDRKSQLSFNFGLRRLPEAMPLADYPPLSGAARRTIIDRFAPGNAWVAREVLGRSDGRLFHAPLPPNDDGPAPRPTLGADDIACAVARIWAHEQARLDTLEARRAELRAELGSEGSAASIGGTR